MVQNEENESSGNTFDLGDGFVIRPFAWPFDNAKDALDAHEVDRVVPSRFDEMAEGPRQFLASCVNDLSVLLDPRRGSVTANVAVATREDPGAGPGDLGLRPVGIFLFWEDLSVSWFDIEREGGAETSPQASATGPD